MSRKRGPGRPRKVGRPRIHPKGYKPWRKGPGRPRKVGRPKGIHTKWRKNRSTGETLRFPRRKR